MYSEKGLAASVSEGPKNDITELTFVFSPSHVPNCCAKGYWENTQKPNPKQITTQTY